MIDINDFIVKATGVAEKRKDKFFRTFCNNCSADKGYLLKSQDKRPTCNKCSKVGNTASKETKDRMSISASFNRKPRVAKQVDGRTVRDVSTYASGYGKSKEQVRIRHNIKSSISNKLRSRNLKKDMPLYRLIGFSIAELKIHLESLFQPGMSWENYGRYNYNKKTWHIDHVKPDSWFDYKSTLDEEFKESWALNNLQPMWAVENLQKSNKYCGSYREYDNAKTGK